MGGAFSLNQEAIAVKEKDIEQLQLQLVQANSKIDLLKVENDHFRRELEKEQHRTKESPASVVSQDYDRMMEQNKLLLSEGDRLREDLKRAREDWDTARKEERRWKDEAEKLQLAAKGSTENKVFQDQIARLTLDSEKQKLSTDRLNVQIEEMASEKKRLIQELDSKTKSLDKLERELDDIKTKHKALAEKNEQLIQSHEAKQSILKTEAEKNYLEAEKKKLEADSFKSRYNELWPKYEEMSRQQGYMQRQIADLEVQNSNLVQRSSIIEQQNRNAIYGGGNIMQSNGLGFLPAPGQDQPQGFKVQLPSGRPSSRVGHRNLGF